MVDGKIVVGALSILEAGQGRSTNCVPSFDGPYTGLPFTCIPANSTQSPRSVYICWGNPVLTCHGNTRSELQGTSTKFATRDR